jgi:hypothetical protein
MRGRRQLAVEGSLIVQWWMRHRACNWETAYWQAAYVRLSWLHAKAAKATSHRFIGVPLGCRACLCHFLTIDRKIGEGLGGYDG